MRKAALAALLVFVASAAPAAPVTSAASLPSLTARPQPDPAGSKAATRKTPTQTTVRGLMEPRLSLKPESGKPVRVALTFDACTGKTDHRILDVLVRERIPATIFATARWLRRNPDTVALLKANPDLFEIENHGAMHVPAVDRPGTIYGIEAAGSPAAVTAEVRGGEDAIAREGFPASRWFRGATARYTASAIEEIGTLGYRVAGFSLNGDDGASVAAATAEKRLSTAGDGDVVIAHINQPDRIAGAGVARGILALKARGVLFVRLEDAIEETGPKAGH